MGGRPAPGALTSSVEEYDPSTNTWATKAPMPTARQNLAAAAAANGRVYAIGGTTDPSNVLAGINTVDEILRVTQEDS